MLFMVHNIVGSEWFQTQPFICFLLIPEEEVDVATLNKGQETDNRWATELLCAV